MDDTSRSKKSRQRQRGKAVDIPTARACLSYEEVSAQTGLSLSTLRRRVQEGKLPFIQPGGRRTRVVFPADVVERLLQHPTDSPEIEPVLPSPEPARSTARPVPHGPKPKWLQDA
jgi:excisionase family DNA binding protein